MQENKIKKQKKNKIVQHKNWTHIEHGFRRRKTNVHETMRLVAIKGERQCALSFRVHTIHPPPPAPSLNQ